VTGQTDLFAGPGRKALGIGLRAWHDSAFVADVERAVRELTAIGRPFTSDDVRARLRLEPSHPNSVGAAMSVAVRHDLCRVIGYRASERPEARGRIVALYGTGNGKGGA
jgi:hypothetical protein